jgi:hypothetical protein
LSSLVASYFANIAAIMCSLFVILIDFIMLGTYAFSCRKKNHGTQSGQENLSKAFCAVILSVCAGK